MPVPPLGIGLAYCPALHALCEAGTGLIDVVEIEPQTLWRPAPEEEAPFRVDASAQERIRRLPQRKLIHSVDCPLGGSHAPETAQADLLGPLVREFEAPWVSDHLAFNRYRHRGADVHAGLFLPPPQTPEGVSTAVANIRMLQSRLGVPIAFETGVNYLQPVPGELSDGAFCARIAREADCGILLDLHNLWTNERNGRQPVRELLAELPLDRVTEIHLAGGDTLQGYWLDAHAGAVPQPVLEIAEELIPALPNLRALVFEILPAHVPRFGLDNIVRELEALRELWNLRDDVERPLRKPVGADPVAADAGRDDAGHVPAPRVAAWERTLGRLVAGEAPWDEGARRLAEDPGVQVLRSLVFNERSGQVVEGLPLTSTLLLLVKGETWFRRLLEDYFRSAGAGAFTVLEALGFARYVETHVSGLAYLGEVVAYEHALLRAASSGTTTEVSFRHDPAALLDSLSRGYLPETLPGGAYTITIEAT